ncbi:MAG: hypothetical protein NVS1B4_21370 [Gemmatimonadaceae bacterium]
MTAIEFTAARERLGLTHDQIAADFDVTPAVVDAWERGKLAVPRAVATGMRFRVSAAERRAVLAGSGLPECPFAVALAEQVNGAGVGQVLPAVKALNAHATDCATCRARTDYMDRHAPALAETLLEEQDGLVARFDRLVERLPRPLRPPPGAAGNGRRVALRIAGALSAYALVKAVPRAIALLASGGWASASWRKALWLAAAVVTAEFVGFFLAGAAYDALRPIRGRVLGPVVRWGLGALIVVVTVGGTMLLIVR